MHPSLAERLNAVDSELKYMAVHCAYRVIDVMDNLVQCKLYLFFLFAIKSDKIKSAHHLDFVIDIDENRSHMFNISENNANMRSG